ncbi:histone deacetylase HDT1-like isoform X2 [Hibiscus syriacus]|uniref:histone deacetylase HDT1-like isoform X2 n=1 Tax=Hibiscus syriacus TaxID=106335 RepID=UPI0019223B34|nr:histone deacetylase HDT1-like isoform X2 [Hibiscus syriacus]
MEFWGIEVKAGQPIKADPGADYVIHLSQASLGESKNKAESVPLYVNANGKKLVLGTLSHQNCLQLSFDLVFDQEFELSHNWKNGSVYFLGYKTYIPEEGDDFGMSSDEESSEEEKIPMVAAESGKAKTDAKTAKANAGKPEAVKQAVKIAEPSKKTEDDDDDDSEDESGSDDSDDSEDEDESDEMSMDGISEDEDEETPKKVESSKKRPVETATPASSKKAKSAVSPQKTDGKKGGGHTATPHPAKHAKKNSAKTPKSGGQFSCGSLSRSIGGGLESRKKAKHGGK